MTDTRAAQLRRLWLNIHLWIGVGLAVLLVPISISGGLLVWHDELDALISPHRYAVTGAQVAHPPSAYLAKAAEAVSGDPADLKATGLRYPEPGWPVRVTTRAQTSAPGERPRFVTVFLDPPTAAVLDVMEFRSSVIGFLHVFHENLMLPQYNGRQIVGWAGVGMLVLSLTGIWLWWPRNGGFVRGLRWRRSPRLTFNLHNFLGLWISIPLAVVSLTGVYLSFPQTARSFMSSVAPMNPQTQRGGFNAQVVAQPALSADRALEIAMQAEPNTTPLTLFMPTEQRRGRTDGTERTERTRIWRVQLTRPESDDPITVMVDDRTGKAAPTAVTARQTGDRAASWIRWIHEGSHSGPVWSVIVFLTGVFPTLFAITGVIMWLRKRAARKALEMKVSDAKQRAAELRPAE